MSTNIDRGLWPFVTILPQKREKFYETNKRDGPAGHGYYLNVLITSYKGPHGPLVPPEKALDMYDKIVIHGSARSYSLKEQWRGPEPHRKKQ